MTSQDSETRRSQASLAPPPAISNPSTPIQSRMTLSPSPLAPTVENNAAAPSDKASFFSPPPASSSDMTPPPSSQMPANAMTPVRREHSNSNRFLASPPATVNQTLCAAYGASENLPSSEDIDDADEDQLRTMAKDLLSVAQESRMAAAHFKLQHSLLSITSSEAVKRAEVEHQLARREVEILQSAEYRNRHSQAALSTPQPSPNNQLEDALKRNKELENTNATLERRLRRAKKLIEDEKDRFELLAEENTLLKKRIRDNRDHFTRMLDHGSLASSPRTEFLTPQHKASQVSRVHGQDPFAALLAADQVLNGEAASVPSTPTRSHKVPKQKHHHGHTRGTHSLSSLPATPSRAVPFSSESRYFTPVSKRHIGSQLAYSSQASHTIPEEDDDDRRDRDSTISASDVEEAVTDDDVPASQATSLATSMLRRFPGSSQEEISVPPNINKSSTLLQSKLFGQVKKPTTDRSIEQLKRKVSYNHEAGSPKKLRAGEY
ncbi:hypothetical protein FQN54_002377 [Arachnomyces sp. PD_36]|nr:hypothetical protein FQN54_002377 [Arachnomyces sp. PD_36]